MLPVVALVLDGLAVVLVAHTAARRSGLPSSVLLVLAGIAYGFAPGPNLRLDPHLVLVVVIPPLLYAAAFESSLVALRGSARAIGGLSVGLVLATALAVGGALSAAVPAVPLAAAVALGAAVAPPDPVAALSIGRRAGLPARLVTLVEGEGLLNDATALTLLTVAVGAETGGSFSLGHALGQLLVSTAGGLAVGVAVGVAVARVRTWLHDDLGEGALSLGTPFVAYLLGEELHVSGVLAVVVTGLQLSHRSPAVQSGPSRLQSRAAWRLVEFLLEGYVFLLIGQQLPGVVRGLDAYSPATVVVAAVVTCGAVLLVRPVWLLATARLPARLHARLGGDGGSEAPLDGREITALTWAGTRGVITLAAAASLPEAFPARDLLLFCAYAVVVVTLLGQGLTFAPLITRLHLGDAVVGEALLRNQARTAAVDAALSRLAALSEAEPELEAVVAPLRRTAAARRDRYAERAELLGAVDDERLPVDDRHRAAVRVRREMIDAEREELLAWRDAGRLPDASLRVLQSDLDHEESVLSTPPAP